MGGTTRDRDHSHRVGGSESLADGQPVDSRVSQPSPPEAPYPIATFAEEVITAQDVRAWVIRHRHIDRDLPSRIVFTRSQFRAIAREAGAGEDAAETAEDGQLWGVPFIVVPDPVEDLGTWGQFEPASCQFCRSSMARGGACTWHPGRVPFLGPSFCHDCGVRSGALHHPGCDAERCRSCSGQAIACDCSDAERDQAERSHDPNRPWRPVVRNMWAVPEAFPMTARVGQPGTDVPVMMDGREVGRARTGEDGWTRLDVDPGPVPSGGSIRLTLEDGRWSLVIERPVILQGTPSGHGRVGSVRGI